MSIIDDLLKPRSIVYEGEEWWEVPTCGILPLLMNSNKDRMRLNEFPNGLPNPLNEVWGKWPGDDFGKSCQGHGSIDGILDILGGDNMAEDKKLNIDVKFVDGKFIVEVTMGGDSYSITIDPDTLIQIIMLILNARK